MRPVPRLTLICQQCGAEYKRMACEVKHKPSRFCSKACSFAAKRRGGDIVCFTCGISFHRKPSDVPEGPGYCSRVCYEARRRIEATSYPKISARHAHRIVAELLLGRPLKPGETVHHIDENKQNFDPSNLQIFADKSEHTRLHSTGKKQSEETVRKRVESRRRTLESKR